MKNKEKPLSDGSLYEERFGFKGRRSDMLFYTLLLVLLLVLCAFRTYWVGTFGGVEVDGSSMLQTLQSGDKLLMKYVRDVESLDYGDVIIVDVSSYESSGTRDTKFLIKRLIAKEGDKVKFENGEMYIWYANTDGYVVLDEPYAYYANRALYKCSEYTVGEGEIFFLGDNRNNSYDSRYKDGGSHLGCLYKASDVYGVVPEWAIKNRKILEKFFFSDVINSKKIWQVQGD